MWGHCISKDQSHERTFFFKNFFLKELAARDCRDGGQGEQSQQAAKTKTHVVLEHFRKFQNVLEGYTKASALNLAGVGREVLEEM